MKLLGVSKWCQFYCANFLGHPVHTNMQTISIQEDNYASKTLVYKWLHEIAKSSTNDQYIVKHWNKCEWHDGTQNSKPFHTIDSTLNMNACICYFACFDDVLPGHLRLARAWRRYD